MTHMPIDPGPIFHAPITGGSGTPLLLRRAALLALTAIGHAAAVLALAAADLLVIEAMVPPKALTGPTVVFQPRAPRPGGAGGSAGSPSGGRTSATAPSRPAPPIHPPNTPPTVIPLPAPSETEANPAGDDFSAAGPPGNGTPGPWREGTSGNGDGPRTGDGMGDDGVGEGRGGVDDPIFVEGHPDITPPVQIPGRAFPRYPEMARKAGVQGTVVLLVVIGRDGLVGAIEVLSGPDPRFGFDLAAIEAVKQWRYRPALLGGRPVAVQAGVTIEFALSR